MQLIAFLFLVSFFFLGIGAQNVNSSTSPPVSTNKNDTFSSSTLEERASGLFQQLKGGVSTPIQKLFEDTIPITFHLKRDSMADLFERFTPLNNSLLNNNNNQINNIINTNKIDQTAIESNINQSNKKKRQSSAESIAINPPVSVMTSPLKTFDNVQLASQSSERAREIDASSQVAIGVSQKLNEQFNGGTTRQDVDLSNFQAPSLLCPFKNNKFCNATDRFQSFDGSCNNLKATWLGKAETPYKRYLSVAYDDGIEIPRSRSVIGGPLPNPRIISRTLFNENTQFDPTFTHFTGIFGQFVAHDITSASVSSGSDGRIVDCPCNSNNPSCMSINMPSNENLMRMSCMRFTRSSAAFPTFDCRLGHREQLNLLTPFLDATQVYGPNESRMRDLRTFRGGQLKTSFVNGKVHLPQAQDGSCKNTDATVKCFAAGEGRTNENVALTSVQTLFLREHNRIASELASINPQWDDNRLFMETRKIIIGIYQNVIFNEYLPSIIGWNTAAMFDLVPLSNNNYYSGYNSNVNPQLANEFASAAFRFGHTSIRNQIGRFDKNNQRITAPLVLQDIIFRPVEIYNSGTDGMESVLRGLINEASSKFDTSFADTLQNHLFESRLSDGTVIAIDLAATNINRGRDHGIPGYNDVREKCGFKKARNFKDLEDLIPSDKVQLLSSVYQHVDDIDLYAGGLSERPVTGATVGSTFACLIANQFKELKRGDRFYYENGPSPTAFTLDQLREIKKSTMSRIICDNVEMNQIQPNAFMMPSSGINNQRISCNWLKSVDLTKWRSQ